MEEEEETIGLVPPIDDNVICFEIGIISFDSGAWMFCLLRMRAMQCSNPSFPSSGAVAVM
ncbi:unnamed protein product [Acanthoscelides obtectus]|uniref:Uncharacterized protein n=1 Tax=Acanthoscelides obtectus TaxID=200917 RepID=A0A9P0JYT3_ACAOB|nr:unnamed protein product [Acanthoscelides obtectus]CAK1639146.1 hypothetical protein AOBTE_LOCUS11016 [Acanthoscelides obtectus]